MAGEAANTQAVADDLPNLQELVGIAQDMVSTLRRRAKPEVPERFVSAFAIKATQTAKAIVILYQADWPLRPKPWFAFF